MRHTVLTALLFLAIAVPSGGCNSKVVGKPDRTYDRLSWIGDAYVKATDALGRPPANREELVPHLKQHGDPAEVLKSDNDGEDFVIFWNIDYRVYDSERKVYPVTAYEKTGKNGRRCVLMVKVVSELMLEDLQAQPFPPGEKPPS